MNKKEYELNDEDFKLLLRACEPVPYMVIGGVLTSSPQESVSRAWRYLGDKMWFNYMTVEPVIGKSSKFFTAVPLNKKEN